MLWYGLGLGLLLRAFKTIMGAIIIILYACTAGALKDLPLTQRTDIANRILPLVEDLKRIWLVGNRESSLQTSVELLERPLEFLLSTSEI